MIKTYKSNPGKVGRHGRKKNDPLTPSPGVILRQEQDDYYKQFSAEFEKIAGD